MARQMQVGNRSNHDLKVKIEFQRTLVLEDEHTYKGGVRVLGNGIGAHVGGAKKYKHDSWPSDFQRLRATRHISLAVPSEANDVCFITVFDETDRRYLCTNMSWETGRYIVIDETGDVCRGDNDPLQPWRKDVKSYHTHRSKKK